MTCFEIVLRGFDPKNHPTFLSVDQFYILDTILILNKFWVFLGKRWMNFDVGKSGPM